MLEERLWCDLENMLVTHIGHTQDKIVEASVVPMLIIKDQVSHD